MSRSLPARFGAPLAAVPFAAVPPSAAAPFAVVPFAAVPFAAVPLQPDREQARSWAVRELARHEYQAARPGPVQRAISAVLGRLGKTHLEGGAPAGIGLAVVALLVLGLAWYLVHRAGGIRRTARRPAGAVLPTAHTTAADHRAAADRYAAAGRWDPAVVERFRAIARELEERALINQQPGRTAREVAREGGVAVPAQANALLAAARSFDDVSYGHLSLGPAADAALRELDAALRSATPVGVR